MKKPDDISYVSVLIAGNGSWRLSGAYESEKSARIYFHPKQPAGILRIVTDGETGKLKSAEVL